MANLTKRETFVAAAAFSTMVLLHVLPRSWSDEAKRGLAIAPEPKIQAMLSRVALARSHDDQQLKEVRDTLKKLKQMAIEAPQVLAPQLIFQSANPRNENEALGTLILVMRFHEFSGLRRPITPFLESGDDRVRKMALLWLLGIDGGQPQAESNLRFYREILLEQKAGPPAGLVDYVYAISPSKALLMFASVYSSEPSEASKTSRSLMWSDHVVTLVKWRLRKRFLQDGDLDKARKEVDGLSRHDDWYARRYAVEILRDNMLGFIEEPFGCPQLGSPEIIERLKKDPNPLVREPAQFIKAQP